MLWLSFGQKVEFDVRMEWVEAGGADVHGTTGGGERTAGASTQTAKHLSPGFSPTIFRSACDRQRAR